MTPPVEDPFPFDGIRVEGLRVVYGRRAAVDGISLALGRGVHGLLGPNGAGKTTLIRVLATVLRPSDGHVNLLGVDAGPHGGLRDLRRRLGYLPQHFGYYPRFSVREFVEYFAWLKEVPAKDIPLAVDRALTRGDLSERASDRMGSLSGGMLRRVGIAQALVNEPELLLLDEPTAGLDPEQRVQFRALLRQLAPDTCIVVATHLVEDVVAACSDVTLMEAGQIAFTGTPERLAAAGDVDDPGDTAAEMGYAALLRRHRQARL
jgi:ABC-2 type transport system ATP-binding protein